MPGSAVRSRPRRRSYGSTQLVGPSGGRARRPRQNLDIPTWPAPDDSVQLFRVRDQYLEWATIESVFTAPHSSTARLVLQTPLQTVGPVVDPRPYLDWVLRRGRGTGQDQDQDQNLELDLDPDDTDSIGSTV